MNPKIRNTTIASLSFLVVAAIVIVLVLVLPARSEPSPTFGPVPQAVLEKGVPVPRDQLPDYISVVGHEDFVVGYVEAPYGWPVLGSEADFFDRPNAVPVVNSRLELVGHLVMRRGFVPLGANPTDYPAVTVTTVQLPAPDSQP